MKKRKKNLKIATDEAPTILRASFLIMLNYNTNKLNF